MPPTPPGRRGVRQVGTQPDAHAHPIEISDGIAQFEPNRHNLSLVQAGPDNSERKGASLNGIIPKARCDALTHTMFLSLTQVTASRRK